MIASLLTDESQQFQSYDHDVRFPSLVEFLQRVTMTAPVVAVEISVRGTREEADTVASHWISANLLPGPAASEPSLLTSYRSVEVADATEVLLDPAREQFMDEFRPWVWDWPAATSERRAADYEDLLARLQSFAQTGRTFEQQLREMVHRGQTLDVQGHAYPLSRSCLELELIEPAEVARLLIAERWQTDRQNVKEVVARLRREREIESAWHGYSTWLRQTPNAPEQIRSAICGSRPIVAWPVQWQEPAPSSP